MKSSVTREVESRFVIYEIDYRLEGYGKLIENTDCKNGDQRMIWHAWYRERRDFEGNERIHEI